MIHRFFLFHIFSTRKPNRKSHYFNWWFHCICQLILFFCYNFFLVYFLFSLLSFFSYQHKQSAGIVHLYTLYTCVLPSSTIQCQWITLTLYYILITITSSPLCTLSNVFLEIYIGGCVMLDMCAVIAFVVHFNFGWPMVKGPKMKFITNHLFVTLSEFGTGSNQYRRVLKHQFTTTNSTHTLTGMSIRQMSIFQNVVC